MRQWKSLVHLHVPAAAAAASSCFPHPPSPSPCTSPPRDDDDDAADLLLPPPPPPPQRQQDGKKADQVVRLVGCDGRVRAYPPPVTARELMQQHPRHLVCRADALLIGEKIPAVAPGEELQPGQAYFLLPAHLFRSVLSFVSLASSLLLLLSTAAAGNGNGNGKAAGGGAKQQPRPFELHRTASGTLQIKFSDDFLVGADEAKPAAAEAKPKAPGVLRGDARLAKDYEELVGYSKSRRWAPKLETIEEVVVVAAAAAAAAAASSDSAAAAAASTPERSSRRSRALPFLGRLGSRRRRDGACSGGSAVACSG